MNIFGVSAQSVKFFLVFCVTPNFVITCLLIWLEEEKKRLTLLLYLFQISLTKWTMHKFRGLNGMFEFYNYLNASQYNVFEVGLIGKCMWVSLWILWLNQQNVLWIVSFHNKIQIQRFIHEINLLPSLNLFRVNPGGGQWVSSTSTDLYTAIYIISKKGEGRRISV